MKKDVTIPPYLILVNKVTSDTIIKFIVAHSWRFGINPDKPAKIFVDNMEMEFSQTELFIPTRDTQIRIVQEQ